MARERKNVQQAGAGTGAKVTEVSTRDRGKVDIQKAVELRLKGLPLEDIAKYFGCSKQAVHKALRPFKDLNPEAVQAFKAGRSDLLAGMELRLIESVTEVEIKKMAPRDRIVAFGILYDKERLERGQSTVNTALFSYIVGEACKPG